MNHQTIEPLHVISEKLARAAADEKERHDRRVEHLMHTGASAQRIFERYIKTGVFVFHNGTLARLEEESIQLRGLMQDFARSLGRPYLRAEKSGVRFYTSGQDIEHGIIDLKVPSSKRLQPIVAPLLLCAKNAESRNKELSTRTPAPVLLFGESGTWDITFVGDAGRQVFKEWLERCHTDPVNRIILKL